MKKSFGMKILLHTHNLMTRAQLGDTWRKAGAEIFSTVSGTQPELIVIDLAAPTAMEQIQNWRDRCPGVEILVFGPHVDGEAFKQAKLAGASGQVARGKVVERVLRKIQKQ
jgi:DNA-binding NarL/FixJ family response regulator